MYNCIQNTKNNQHQSTISKILADFKSLGLPEDPKLQDAEVTVSEFFGERVFLQKTVLKLGPQFMEKVINFDHSLKDEYNKLGIEELFGMPQKEELSADGAELTISGAFVKLQDVKVDNKVKLVEIQALVEVGILQKQFSLNSNVSIIAPAWNIGGNIHFDLLQSQGVQNYGSRAKDGLDLTLPQNFYIYGSEQLLKKSIAQDGLPGKPGKPGPSFFGFGISAYSDEKEATLYLTSTGGVGGKGQDAGNGSKFSIYQLRAHGNYQKYHDIPYQKLSESVVEAFSGKIGGGGLGGSSGTLQLAFDHCNVDLRFNYPKGKSGEDGKKGQAGVIVFQFMEPIPGKIITQVVPATEESIPNPVGYDTIIRYENYLVELLGRKDIQKDIAYAQLLYFLSQNCTTKYYQKLVPYTKFEFKHFIEEMNVVAKVYNKFLFEKDFLTQKQMNELFINFKYKFSQIVYSYNQLSSDDEKIARKIVTYFFMIERSLKMAHATLDFDYLNSFLNDNSPFQFKDILKKYAQENEKFFNQACQNYQQAKYYKSEAQKQIENIVPKIYQKFNKLYQKYKDTQSVQDKKQCAQKLSQQLPIMITGKMLDWIGKVLSYIGLEREFVTKTQFNTPKAIIELINVAVQNTLEGGQNPALYFQRLNRLVIDMARYQIQLLKSLFTDLPSIEQIKEDITTTRSIRKYLERTKVALEDTNNTISRIAEDRKKLSQNRQHDAQLDLEEKNTFYKRQKLMLILNALVNIGITGDTVITARECLDVYKLVVQSSSHFQLEIQWQFEELIYTITENFIRKMGYVDQLPQATFQAPCMAFQFVFKCSLNEILQFFRKSQQKFKSEFASDIYSLINDLATKTNTLSQSYRIIENCKSQGELGKLIIGFQQSLPQSFPGVTEMDQNFKKLVIIKEGNNILNNFKQAAFPSSPYYSYDAYYKITKKDKAASVDEMMNELKNLYKAKMLSKSIIGQENSAFIKTDKNAVFYTFDGELEIRKLLQGEIATIQPDVRLSPKDRDAIKFTEINLRLELKPGATEEIKASFLRLQQKMLDQISVKMTSSGNYFYRYGEVYYNLPSAQLRLEHSYDPTLANQNQTYKIVRDGQPLFSPYTSWRIRFKVTDISFQDDTEKCLSQLQLTFYGTAVYLDSQASAKIPVHDCYKSFEANILAIVPKS